MSTRSGWSAAALDSRPEGAGGGGVASGSDGARVRDAVVDVGAGGRDDRAVTGVRYHPGHGGGCCTSWLVGAAAGPSGRRTRRGGDRPLDQEGLAAGNKSARRRRAWIVFHDESGVSLTPVVRATWAPSVQTPVLRHRFNWKRMSMSAARCYRPDRSAAELVFATQPGAYTTETLIDFLGQPHAHVGQNATLTLLWDGLSSHRSRDMSASSPPAAAGCASNACPPTPPNSTRSKACGATSKEPNWPTAAPTPSTRRCRPRATDSTASPTTPICASRRCATPVFLYDQNVTELCEPL